jgi:hypothetical protein
MNNVKNDSWEHVLAKMDFCKLLINLLSYEYASEKYDNVEGFLILNFIEKQQIYLSKLYQIEYNSLKKYTIINPEFNYNLLSENQKITLMIKSILNLLYRYIDNKNVIFYNKTNILNLLGYLEMLKKDYKLNIKNHKKILKYVYDITNNILI